MPNGSESTSSRITSGPGGAVGDTSRVSAALTVKEVTAEVTYPLRGLVLRPNGGEIVWAGDEDPATVHLAARTADGAVVGVVRFHPAPCPYRSGATAPWQL